MGVHCQLVFFVACNLFAFSLQDQCWLLIPYLQPWYFLLPAYFCLFCSCTCDACGNSQGDFGVHRTLKHRDSDNICGFFTVFICSPSAQTIQTLPFSAGFWAPWGFWALNSGPGLLKSLGAFLFLVSLSISVRQSPNFWRLCLLVWMFPTIHDPAFFTQSVENFFGPSLKEKHKG